MKFEWEILSYFTTSSYHLSTNRARVPGGWLIKESFINYGGESKIKLLFLEDKEHSWSVEE